MKKYFMILLSSIALMTSCKEEQDVSWDADTLTIACDALENAGDGNLKLIIPTQYKSTAKLQISSNSTWNISIDNMTTEEDAWVSSSVTEGNGNAEVDLSIDDNDTNADRICSVVIATSGNIPVKKTITIVQGNADDLLSLSIGKQNLPTGVTISENLDGSLQMVLSKSYTGRDFTIYVDGEVEPSVDIEIPEDMPQDWITQQIISPEPTRSPKSSSVSFTVSENSDGYYREAFITFTSQAGEVVTKKVLKVSQVGEEAVEWCGNYFQGSNENLDKAEVILPSTILSDVQIGKLKNMKPENIELPEVKETDWFTLSVNAEGQVLLTVTKENNTKNKENLTNVVLKSKLSEEEFSIPVRQCMPEFGVVLNKKQWTGLTLGQGLGISSQQPGRTIDWLIDGKWSNESSKDLQLEIWAPQWDYNFELVIDLGEDFKEYNHVGIMPRLQWTQPSPSKITVEVSSNKTDWTKVIDNADYYTKDELSFENASNKGKPWENHFNDVTAKLVDLGENMTKQYIKLIFPVNSSFNTNKNFFCFEEVFVTYKQ